MVGYFLAHARGEEATWKEESHEETGTREHSWVYRKRHIVRQNPERMHEHLPTQRPWRKTEHMHEGRKQPGSRRKAKVGRGKGECDKLVTAESTLSGHSFRPKLRVLW